MKYLRVIFLISMIAGLFSALNSESYEQLGWFSSFCFATTSFLLTFKIKENGK